MIRLLRQAVVAELAAADRASFAFSLWHSFDESDWSRALDWLDVSGLALYFWHKVKTVNVESALPLSVQTRLARSYEENCLRVEFIRKESAALNRLFDYADVQYAVLKGFSLVPDYCPDPTLRTQYDHDYLIRPDALAQAEALLQRAGYRPKASRGDYHIAYVRPAPEIVPSGGPLGPYSAGLERPVELHIGLWEVSEERIGIPLPDDFVTRLRKRSRNGFDCPALNDEDALIFQVLHAFRHILRNWCRLSTFLEISHFLRWRASDLEFWPRYRDRIADLRRVPEASAVVFRLAQKLFGGSIPDGFGPLVAPKFSSVLDLWIERYGLSGALANFRSNKNSLLIHREFVDSRSAWAKVWKHRLFPFRWPHHLPNVLRNQASRGFGRTWAQYKHGLRRFKFHALSVLCYAWEYPQWQLLRRVCARDQPEVSWDVQEKTAPKDCKSGWSPTAVVTQPSNTSPFRD